MGRADEGPRPFDLRHLDLAPGEAREFEHPVEVGDVRIGGQRYTPVPAVPTARVEVSQSASGWHFRLRVEAAYRGSCWRCLEEAQVPLRADVRDFAAFGRGAAGAPFDEDLDCEYLDGESLDIAAMARDALVELLPSTILCRPECAGLCPSCGANLNIGPCGCDPPSSDGRWEALREIAERLGSDG